MYFFDCICDCGNSVCVRSGDLVFGTTKSCGCYQRDRLREERVKDLRGLRFGRLLVVDFAFINKNHKSVWMCKCDCGAEINVLGNNMATGDIRSCGCLHKELLSIRNTTHGLSRTKEWYKSMNIINRDRRNGLDSEWDMRAESMLSEFFPTCVVCGGADKMATDHVLPVSRGHGLSVGNAVRLCIHCNSKKNNSTPQKMNKGFGEEAWKKVMYAASEFKRHYENLSETNLNGRQIR